MFQRLEEKASTPALRDLVAYIKTTWIESSLWSPEAWCVFMKSIRTNNDVEGWHFWLNRHAAKASLPMHLLIYLLHEEAHLMTIQVHLLDKDRVYRYRRKTYQQLQGRLHKCWEEFNVGEQSTKKLLSACFCVYGPSV